MKDQGNKVRQAMALVAARIMYEEGVKQYFTAKRLAARRLFSRKGGKQMRYRPGDLPSNGEIRHALLSLAELLEGDSRTRRLFAMRVVALETMEALASFSPRLIGSVASGHIRRGSDIDIHVFCDGEEGLFSRLKELGWTYDVQRVSLRKGGEFHDYLHVYLEDIFSIELTVYETRALRDRPRSSTDGKPIVRTSAKALRALLHHDHPEEWARYERNSEFPDVEELLSGSLDLEMHDAPLPEPKGDAEDWL